MAEVEKKDWTQEDFTGRGRNSGLVVLDRLQDPGNVGTIIRTADGAGIAGIICVKGTCDIYSPKTLRSSVGSIFRVPIIFVDTDMQAIDLCHSLGVKVAVSCFEGACDYRQAPLGKECAIVVGNEGQGASDVFLERADIRVKIPMFGSLESLNASVAASLLMYEAARKGW